MEPHTGDLSSSATRVKIVASGRRIELVKTGGTSRDLGREIVQTTGAEDGEGHSAKLKSIPITVVST